MADELNTSGGAGTTPARSRTATSTHSPSRPADRGLPRDNPDDDRLPDVSPAGQQAVADLAVRTLAELDAAEAAGHGEAAADPAAERRCAVLLRERLTAELGVHDAGEGYRAVRNMGSPLHNLREVFTLLPTDTEEDWARLGRRLARLPLAVEQYRATLAEGIERGLLSGPRQVGTLIEQIGQWLDTERGDDVRGGWFGDLVAPAPASLRAELAATAVTVAGAFAELRDWLAEVYAPAAADTPDTIGRTRYARWARQWTGADVDFDEAYRWAWTEFHQLDGAMRAEAEKVRPGSTPMEAMRWLESDGPAVKGEEPIRLYLQGLLDRAIEDLQGVHFDLAEPITRVESMIAPAGSAAAPYYSAPSLDFSRPDGPGTPPRDWSPSRPGTW